MKWAEMLRFKRTEKSSLTAEIMPTERKDRGFDSVKRATVETFPCSQRQLAASPRGILQTGVRLRFHIS